MDDRKQRERAFHNDAFSGSKRSSLDRFYSISSSTKRYFERVLLSHVAPGSEVLEIGCGVEETSILLARAGANVTAIDISDVAVATAEAQAREAGVGERARFIRMDAEHLDFPAASFNLVCGVGILHHLSLGSAYPEVARVLRSTGVAVFIEPLGHNPLINAFRRRTPQYRTPDEHPLLISDLELAASFFGSVSTKYFHLFGLLAVPLSRTPLFQPARATFHALDQALFDKVPALRRYAWQAVITLAHSPSAKVVERSVETRPAAAA